MVNNPKSTTGGEVQDVSEPFTLQSFVGEVDDVLARAMPRSGMYVTPQDKLWFNATSQINNIVFRAQWRILRPDGTIVDEFQNFTYTGAGNGQFIPFPLMEGWLLSVVVGIQSGNVPQGACTILVLVGVLNTTQGIAGALLLQDNMTSSYYVAWPGTGVQHPTAGIGWQTALAITVPGAGANFVYDFPQNKRQRVMSIGFDFTTAVAVANRVVRLQLGYAGSQNNIFTSGFTQAASLTVHYEFVAGGASVVSDTGCIQAPLPTWIDSDCSVVNNSIVSVIANIQAADQLANLFIRLQQWHEND